MNFNNLPVFNVPEESAENLINYFFNHYKGNKIPKICKGKFLINVFQERNNDKKLLLYVEQSDEFTSVSVIKNNRVCTTVSFNELNLELILENNQYFITYEKENSFDSQFQLKDEENLEYIQPYIIATFFISSFFDKLEYKVTVNSSKKKRKHTKKEYTIDKKFVDQVTKLNFEDNIEHSSLDLFTHIKTSIKNINSFKEYLKDVHVEKFVYLPFEEFVIDFDRNITQIFCKFNGDKESLECIVFKSKSKVFAIDINLNDGKYRAYTFYDFFNFEQKNNLDISGLKADIVNIIQSTLNFIVFFKVKKTIVKKDWNDTIKNTDKKKIHSSNICVGNTVYINTQKVYEVDISSVIKNPILRKKPVYVKQKWERRGYVRTLKSGKEIYVKPTTCSRKKNKNTENITENSSLMKTYIIS